MHKSYFTKSVGHNVWHLVEKVEGQLNDDGTVNFYYDTKHNLNFCFNFFLKYQKNS